MTSVIGLLSSNAEAMIYEVGPDKKYKEIFMVPFDALEPGDVVDIFFRQNPYRDRIVLRRSGTKQQPIIIRGIASAGKIPIIDGKFARQFQKEVWKNSGRWSIKVGDGTPGDYVRIENLVLRNANNTNSTIEAAGQRLFTDNAAGIFLRAGKNVVISNCRIYSCGNAILTYYAPDVTDLDYKGYKKADAFVYGNVIIQGRKLGLGKLWNYRGTLRGMNNWFSTNITYPEEKLLGMKGNNPGFYLNSALPFLPSPGAPLINNGTPKIPLPVKYMANPVGGVWKRPVHQGKDIGAYEYFPSIIKKISKRK